MPEFSIRVVLLDDHPTILFGLTHLLAQAGSIDVVGTCQSAAELTALLKHQQCDVIVADYSMPGDGGADGFALVDHLRRHHPSCKVIVFTVMDSPFVLQPLVCQGVSCIVSKADAMGHVITAVHTAYAGGQYLSPAIRTVLKAVGRNGTDALCNLTPRETEVLRLLMSGLTVTDVAARLNKSKQTISDQRKSAMRKIGAVSNIDLIKYAIHMKLVPPGPTAAKA